MFGDIPGLLRDEDSELIARVRNGTGDGNSNGTTGRGGGYVDGNGDGSGDGGTGGARAFAPPLPPLKVSAGDGVQFGLDADADADADVAAAAAAAAAARAAAAQWGDHCFPFDRCRLCAQDQHCGWCAVEATCYAAVGGVGKDMCGGGWVATAPTAVGECPPEASGAVLLPPMELDTAASRVPFVLDNLVPGCGGRGGCVLRARCCTAGRRAGGRVSARVCTCVCAQKHSMIQPKGRKQQQQQQQQPPPD